MGGVKICRRKNAMVNYGKSVSASANTVFIQSGHTV